jgi:hypothetical protein
MMIPVDDDDVIPALSFIPFHFLFIFEDQPEISGMIADESTIFSSLS